MPSHTAASEAWTRLAAVADRKKDAKEFEQAAQKLKGAYYKTFYNPETGMLAGWKSHDGNLHDYAFTFIQGIAITYGVVDDTNKANKLLDAMFKKMQEVGILQVRSWSARQPG